MGPWGKSICSDLRIRSSKPDAVAVKDALSHIHKIKIRFSRNLKADANAINIVIVFQSMAADVSVSHFFPWCLLFNYTSSQIIYLSSAFIFPPLPLSTLSHFPPVLSSVSICSCFPPPLLSCHCCLLPLVSCSNYITAPVSRLQILTGHQMSISALHCQGQDSGSVILILDTFLKSG